MMTPRLTRDATSGPRWTARVARKRRIDRRAILDAHKNGSLDSFVDRARKGLPLPPGSATGTSSPAIRTTITAEELLNAADLGTLPDLIARLYELEASRAGYLAPGRAGTSAGDVPASADMGVKAVAAQIVAQYATAQRDGRTDSIVYRIDVAAADNRLDRDVLAATVRRQLRAHGFPTPPELLRRYVGARKRMWNAVFRKAIARDTVAVSRDLATKIGTGIRGSAR